MSCKLDISPEVVAALEAVVDCENWREAALQLGILGFPVVIGVERAFLRYEHGNFVFCARAKGVTFPSRTHPYCHVVLYGQIRAVLEGTATGYAGDYESYTGVRRV